MSGRNALALDRLLSDGERCCRWCGRGVVNSRKARGNPGNAVTVDHILPRAWGGTTLLVDGTVRNVVLSCQDCNQLRSIAGHCIGALACAVDVRGRRAKGLAQWFGRPFTIGRPHGAERVPFATAGWQRATLADAFRNAGWEAP